MEIVITSHMGSFSFGKFGYGKYKKYTELPEDWMLDSYNVRIISAKEAKNMVLVSCRSDNGGVLAIFADDLQLRQSTSHINILKVSIEEFKDIIEDLRISMWIKYEGYQISKILRSKYKEVDGSNNGEEITLHYFNDLADGRNARHLKEMGFKVVLESGHDVGMIYSPSYTAMKVAISKLDNPLIREKVNGEWVTKKKWDYE